MSARHQLSDKEVFWSTHVHDWLSGSLSAKAYCELHELNIKSLYRWVPIVKQRGLKKSPATSTKSVPLIPVTVLPDAAQSATDGAAASHGCRAGIRILVPGKYVLELDIGFDAPSLERLLQTWSRA